MISSREGTTLTPRPSGGGTGTTAEGVRRPILTRSQSRPRELISGRMDSSVSDDSGPGSLLRQNHDLRNRLNEETTSYKRRLDTYRQAQQNQTALVSRLQAKVLQYKQRCADLEGKIHDNMPDVPCRGQSLPATCMSSGLGTSTGTIALPSISSAMQESQNILREMHEIRDERINDLETALRKLEEERRKCENIIKLNTVLREQLEESHNCNEALTSDLQKLTNDWGALREEMIAKEDEWKEEEQAFNDYYTTEHNRLLGIWRDAVSVKRLFCEMQAVNERDLSKMRTELASTTREVIGVCNGMISANRLSSKSGESQQFQAEQEASELRSQLSHFRTQHESTLAEISQKESRIQQLLRDIQVLEERCAESEHHVAHASRCQEEVDLLQGALRDIAHAVLQDAESVGPAQATHVHLSQTVNLVQRSPKRGMRGPTSPAFAEGTISAVQAALHKYQLMIHELQVKLKTTKDALGVVKKQCDSVEGVRDTLSIRVTELTAQLDTANDQLSQCCQEREATMKNLEQVRQEKYSLELNRLEINAMVDSLNSDYEKLQKSNGKLKKHADNLEDEKRFLQNELDRMTQEASSREMAIRAEEERTGRLREELLTIREELSNVYLSRDMLEQQRLESDELIAHISKVKDDIELELEKVLLERADLQETLEKTDNNSSNLEGEMKRLNDEIKLLQDDRSSLQTQCSDQQNDLGSLRKELLVAEQARLDLESDKLSSQEKNKFLEIEKEKVEQELVQSTRDRGELSNQLAVITRKKEALSEELMRIQQRLEQATETNFRVNKNLEDLVKENEEKQVMLEAGDKEMQRLHEQLAALRSEKESLEAALFDTNTNLEECEIKRSQLEKDQQDLLVAHESLKGQVLSLKRDLENSERRAEEMKANLTQQASAQESEFKQIIANLKKSNNDSCRKLNEEKEQVRSSLEKRLQTSLLALSREKDNEIEQLQHRTEDMQNHIEVLCQQHEEVMLRAENDKQQSLLIAHHDHQALLEKLESTRRELEAERSTLEKARREANARAEQDRNAANQLREEITRAKARMEEIRSKASEEHSQLEITINEIKQERDVIQRGAEEVKLQLSLCEDRIESTTNQLQETVRKLKEVENAAEAVRKELTDTRRQLAESNVERDKYSSSNRELREHVKRAEGDRREQARSLEEALQKLASLEETKNSLELEKARLQTIIREGERVQLQTAQQLTNAQNELVKAASDNSHKQAEEKELQSRLNNEFEERERVQQELNQLKKQMSELDSNLEATRQELCRSRSRLAHEESRWHCREQELLGRLEDSRGREKRLEDQKHNLEVCLADATQQIQELKARLGGAEGRVRALDAQLAHLEAAKKDVEQKLCSVGCTLRRIAGIQLDGTVSLPYRLLSPTRRWSPARGGRDRDHDDTRASQTGAEVIDVDPEIVRKGVRGLMQQVAQLERERDDYKAQVGVARKQQQETNELQSKGDAKLAKTINNLRALQNEKGSLEALLGQKTAALQAQTEALQQKSEEVNIMRDKITTLELAISSGLEEKVLCEDRLEKCRAALSRLEAERRAIQEELARCEQRASKLELQRVAHEGDVQRLQMVLQERDATIQKLQERLEVQTRTVAALEDRCGSLKTTIEQLSMSLDRAANAEAELRSEITSLQMTQHNNVANSQAANDKIKHLQKSLQNAENERRVLAERLEAAQHTSTELRRINQVQTEQLQRLQSDLSNIEVQRSALESQLRLSSWSDNSNQKPQARDDELQRQLLANQKERTELRGKVDALTDKVRQLESDKRSLERNAAKQATSRGKSFDRIEMSEMDTNRLDPNITRDSALSITRIESGLDQSLLEQENKELRLKIRYLENQLAEKEAELARLRSRVSDMPKLAIAPGEAERHRAAQLQAERLLEAREQSHRQQVLRLENQITILREQFAQEAKRRQMYVLRSTRAGREMQQLRQTLGDSLRHVSQDPTLDAMLLEHEARRLDSAVAMSLPPSTLGDYDKFTP